MSDTQKKGHVTEAEIQAQAKTLKAILEKHKPAELKDLAFELMQTEPAGSDKFKCYAALYELLDIFNK